MEVLRLWKWISFSENWSKCDTSILDDIAQSWFTRREVLKANSQEYVEFIAKLKRKHAIETGIVERMYDLEKGVTETLIKEGFVSALISHGATNIPKQTLLNHLKDHLDAVDFVFDVVKENRPLTKGFIFELHQLTTRHQEYAEGRDQFGYKTKIALIKGRFKERENNPTREDGVKILYCPPEHVEAEMDRLIQIYDELTEKRVHPLIIAAWVHHAFTTIHPFQDGNGRVVRLIASLILIKHNFFPITVLREEAKIKYINALEAADADQPQKLVTYFAEIQKKYIEEALNLREVANTTLKEVTSILKEKVLQKQKDQLEQYETLLNEKRNAIFNYCSNFLNEYKIKLENEFGKAAKFYISSGRPTDTSKQNYYYEQIVAYASKHNYFFNRTLPKSYFVFGIDLQRENKYELVLTIHHFGYDESAIAIGAFLEYKNLSSGDSMKKVFSEPLELNPHVITINDNVSSKEKNIKLYLENVLTAAIAQIASEI